MDNEGVIPNGPVLAWEQIVFLFAMAGRVQDYITFIKTRLALAPPAVLLKLFPFFLLFLTAAGCLFLRHGPQKTASDPLAATLGKTQSMVNRG